MIERGGLTLAVALVLAGLAPGAAGAVGAAAAEGAAGAEAEKPAEKTVFQIDGGRITLNKKERSIRIGGYFCCEEGPLEYLICLKGGKEYESVFAADCDARQLNVALLALGYSAGGDVGRLGDARLPRGDAVTISIEWEADGKTHSRPGSDFMYNVYTKKSMRRTPWIYTGSRFEMDPMTERREYLAQMDGVIAATYRDPAAIFNSPLNTGVDDVFYNVHTKIVPGRGTKGVLVIKPTTQPKADELDDGAKLAPEGGGENPPKAPEKDVKKGESVEEAKKLAKMWFIALMGGKVADVLAVSDVPFSWDRKKVIEDKADLEAMYEEVVAKKGARDVKPTKVEVAAGSRAFLEKGMPKDRVVVHLFVEDERVAVCIRPGKELKVVGFSD